MLPVHSDDPVLDRFARDLDAQSPLPLHDAALDLSRAHAADVEAARVTWANRVVDEYRGFVVFSEVLVLLGDAAAPFPALCAVQRVVGDELRHVRLCGAVVEWLGGWGDLFPDLEGLRPARTGGPALAQARGLVALEMTVGETESVPMFEAFRGATEEGPIRRVLEVILHDEVRHAAVGRSLLTVIERCAEEAGVASDPGLEEAMESARARIREGYRRAATGGPGRALGASIRVEDLRVVGR